MFDKREVRAAIEAGVDPEFDGEKFPVLNIRNKPFTYDCWSHLTVREFRNGEWGITHNRRARGNMNDSMGAFLGFIGGMNACEWALEQPTVEMPPCY